MIQSPYDPPASRVRSYGRRAFRAHPGSETAMSLDGFDDATLATLPRFRALHTLRLSTCTLGEGALRALRALPELRALYLWRCKVTAPGLLDALAAVPLRTLHFDRISDDLAPSSVLRRCPTLEDVSVDLMGASDAALFDALRELPRLRWLTILTAEQLSDEDIPRFAAMHALENLHLHSCGNVRGSTLDALGSVQNLRALSLVSCDIQRDSLARLTALRALRALDLALMKGIDLTALLPLQSLEVLDIMSTNPTAEALEGLGEMRRLTHLTLNSCGAVTEDTLRSLSSKLSLRALGVGQTGVSGACFEDAARWSEFEDLDAGFTKLDDAALGHLAKLPRLRRLEMVYCNEVTAEGLARITDFPALVDLNVQGVNAVDDATVAAWARRPRWEDLSVYGCANVTGRSVAALVRAHPDVIVSTEPHRLHDRHLAPSETYDHRVGSIEVSEDPSLVALVTSQGAVMLLDRPSGKRRNRKSIPAKGAGVRLDPKGRLLLAFGKRTRLWDATTAQELEPPAFKLTSVDDAAFSADGKLLAITGVGGTRRNPQRLVHVWDVRKSTLATTIEGELNDEPVLVQFSPDARHVLLAHESLEVFARKSGERVFHREGVKAPACFDATGEHVLGVVGGDVVRFPLDGAKESVVFSWRALLDGAPGATVLSERAEIALSPDHEADLREIQVDALYVRGAEVVLTALGGGYPGATALVVGARALWLQCDVWGERAVAITPDAKTVLIGYPQDRPTALAGRVGAWDLDALLAAAHAT